MKNFIFYCYEMIYKLTSNNTKHTPFENEPFPPGECFHICRQGTMNEIAAKAEWH